MNGINYVYFICIMDFKAIEITIRLGLINIYTISRILF